MKSNDYRGNLLGISFEYEPACPPVIWAEAPQDVPPWDWTRTNTSINPFLFLPISREFAETHLGWEESRDAHEAWGYPRLVREHPGTCDRTPFQGLVVSKIAKLWELTKEKNWREVGSKFRNQVLKTVHEVGLLRPSEDTPTKRSSNIEADTIQTWFCVSLELFVWLEFLRLLENAKNNFPLSSDFWNDIRENYATAQQIKEGENFSLTWWVPREAQRDQDFTGWWFMPEPTFGQQWFSALHWENEFIAKKVTNFRDACNLIAKEFMKQFIKVAGDSVKLRPSQNGQGFTVFVRAGAWAWSLYELAQLYAALELQVCACGKPFSKGHGNIKYCSTTCRERYKKRRLKVGTTS
jgi:hypothetical protein